MSIEELKNIILAEKAKHSELDALNSSSKVSLFHLWAYVIASIAWVQYQYFDLFKTELNEQIAAQKLYTLRWFRDAALAYRHGHALDEDTGAYPTTSSGYSEEDIAAAQIVAQAAVIEVELDNRKHLFIKVAKDTSTSSVSELTALSEDEQKGLQEYIARIKPAGTKIVVSTGEPDQLRLEVDFHYDPLILNSLGERIDGTSTGSVADAIRAYIQTLEFNGELTLANLEHALAQVPGCANREVYIRTAEANTQDPANWQPIEAGYVAESGYMAIADEDLTINFIAKNTLL